MKNSIILMEKYLTSFKNNQTLEKKYQEYQTEFLGLTGAGTAQLISNCVKFMNKDYFYLEIGIFQGANLVSVAASNKNKKCIGVDNFSEHFQETKDYSETEEELVFKRLKKYNCNNVEIYKDDFRNWISNNVDKYAGRIGVYMYDGPHGLQDQIDGVEMVLPMLSDNAMIFIDDLASENTQEATKILLEKYKNNLSLMLSTPNDCNKFGYQQGQVVLKFVRN